MKRFLLVAAFLCFGQSALAADEVGEVRADETEKISRRFTSRQFKYLAIGPFYLDHAKNDKLAHHLGLGYVWDSSIHASVKAVAEGVIAFDDPKAAMVNFGLGANYFFMATPISPFIGADFGYGGFVSNSDELKSVSGFSFAAAAGVAFFRTAGTQLQLQLRRQIILEEGTVGRPGYYGLSLALLY